MGCLIGVDGGATGTTAVLADRDGTLRAIAQGAASNYLTEGQAHMEAVFADLIQDLLAQTKYTPADCEQAVFGLAALGSPEDRGVYQAAIDRQGLGGQIILESDVVIAWAAATQARPGIGVIAGTGSSCFGINAQGKRARSLGWDYVLADQGSGYAIGSAGLKIAMKIFDGRITDSTALLTAMLEHFDLSAAEDMLTVAYQPNFTKRRIASFARQVSRCAIEGDTYARDILTQAGRELAQGVWAVAHRLNMIGDMLLVGCVGGVFQAGGLVMSAFQDGVQHRLPGATVQLARYPPVIGAILFGQFAEENLTDDFIHQIDVSMSSLPNLGLAK